jgi:hypothetical protein
MLEFELTRHHTGLILWGDYWSLDPVPFDGRHQTGTASVTADDVLERMRRLGSAPCAHLDSVLNTRCRYFIELPAGERLSVLPKLMDTFEPAYAFVASQGGPPRAGMIEPSAFAYTDDDWPNFEW